MSNLFIELKEKLQQNRLKKIVFPEAYDERILQAASILAKEKLLLPVLIGQQKEITRLANTLNVDISTCKIIDPSCYLKSNKMREVFMERRDGSIHKETANQLLKEPNYFGTMLVYMGIADGLVSGAVYSTSDTVRPALKIIKTKKGVSKASGIFILIHNDRKYFFADCAINIAPTSKELAEIAIESAKTAKIFHVSPRIAMLSFSTKGSACSKETERVIEAVEFVQKQYPQLKIDGELQFDTAFMPTVAAKKSTNSVIKGDANIFIFPSLEAGNIGYKMIQCLGGVESVGAIIQGLNKPVNDLSRGCSIDDVYKLALITAAQAK